MSDQQAPLPSAIIGPNNTIASVVSLGLSADGHPVGLRVDGTTSDPGPVKLSGDTSGTSNATSTPKSALVYTSSGLSSAPAKIFLGTTVTDQNGAFSFDYTDAGFTSIPRVKVQAIATGTTASDAVVASPTAPTLTGVAGFVVKPASTMVTVLGTVINPFAMGNAGITVQLTASGT